MKGAIKSMFSVSFPRLDSAERAHSRRPNTAGSSFGSSSASRGSCDDASAAGASGSAASSCSSAVAAPARLRLAKDLELIRSLGLDPPAILKEAPDQIVSGGAKLLGKGGEGSVYRVDAGGRSWAVKKAPSYYFEAANYGVTSCFAQSHLARMALGREELVLYPLCRGSLADALCAAAAAGAPLGAAALRDLASELACGMAHVHDAGYAHHDVKPQNVLVTELGHLKYCDFGLSSRAGVERFCGTDGYIAPELLPPWWARALRALKGSRLGAALAAAGLLAPLRPADGRELDIFALGVTFLDMLTAPALGPNGAVNSAGGGVGGPAARAARRGARRAREGAPAALLGLLPTC
ncbi:MAG: kinase-like domain-containing protein [Monoraphidium minutum]|nr:MAG: kinase-like domain-containing protein [Monoraphidium minutum]